MHNIRFQKQQNQVFQHGLDVSKPAFKFTGLFQRDFWTRKFSYKVVKNIYSLTMAFPIMFFVLPNLFTCMNKIPKSQTLKQNYKLISYNINLFALSNIFFEDK